MLRKGYLEQQVEGLSIALGKLLLLKKESDATVVLQEIRASGKELMGLDPATLTALSDDTLLLLCSAHGILDAGKAVVAASLLDQQAQMQWEQGHSAVAAAGWQKALVLLTEALRFEPKLRTEDFLSLTERIRAALPATPVPLLRRLFLYYDDLGQYAHAEDMLFALQEADPGAATRAESIAFYERLLKLPDEVLIAANLPRDEVLEGLESAKAG